MKSVRGLGFWSAILCTVFSLAYVVAQLAEWADSSGWPPAITFPATTGLLAIHFGRLRAH
jgi:hypothetical protein